MIRPWMLATALVALLATSVAYFWLGPVGSGPIHSLRALADRLQGRPDAAQLMPPSPGIRPAAIHWIGADGLWSSDELPAPAAVAPRIEAMTREVLRRRVEPLSLSRALLDPEGLVYLIFTPGGWRPGIRGEVELVQSVTRTLLSDLPWLEGVRMDLPFGALDRGAVFHHYDRGYDPRIWKTLGTLAPEVADRIRGVTRSVASRASQRTSLDRSAGP